MALTGGQKYTPVKYNPTGPALDDFVKHIHENCETLDTQWADYVSNKLPEYRRVLEGRPRQESKSFPWQNASNIVVQLIGASTSTLKAKIISSVFELSPLWVLGVIGEWGTDEKAGEQQQALEQFLTYCGLEPEELDLYRVENLWCQDMIAFGHSVIKVPYEKQVDYQKISIGDASDGGTDSPIIRRDGPTPEKIPIEDFKADIKAATLDKAPFKKYTVHLDKFALLDRKYRGAYDKDAVEKILQTPDSNGPSPELIEKWQKDGFDASQIPCGAYWNIEECWFDYWINEKKYRLIVSYHFKTKTILRSAFNFYPDNEIPFVQARLGYSEDGLLGRGYTSLLKDYQEEVTVGHNQRVDKRTLLNTNIFRVGPNSKFDAHFRFSPMMTIPAAQGDFEPMSLGQDTYPNSVNDEMLTLKLGEDLVGVGASTSGMGGLGSGTVGKTTGAYSSMGTYSVMQDGNRRVGQSCTDFKYAHIRLGKLVAKMYGHFGAEGKAKAFGLKEDIIRQALDNFRSGKLIFPIKAATSSINREVEKQNYLLLESNLQRYYTAQGQIIQATGNPQIDPVLKDYLTKTLDANTALMEKILTVFDIDDKSVLLPKTMPQGQNNGSPEQQLNAGATSVDPSNPQQPGNGSPIIPGLGGI
jgi:hypothetical protein